MVSSDRKRGRSTAGKSLLIGTRPQSNRFVTDHLVDHYFDSLGNFGLEYVRNRYLEDLRDQGYGPDLLPFGWPTQLDISELFDKLPTTP